MLKFYSCSIFDRSMGINNTSTLYSPHNVAAHSVNNAYKYECKAKVCTPLAPFGIYKIKIKLPFVKISS